MKKLLLAGLAMLVLLLLSVPVWAQKGGHGKGAGKAVSKSGVSQGQAASHSSQASQRSNKGGEVRGLDRAREVQGMNTKADAKRGFPTASGLDKAEQKASTKAGGTSQTGSPSQKARAGKAKGKHWK